MKRYAEIERQTRETSIHVTLDLDGTGTSAISTGIGFLDHMLDLFARARISAPRAPAAIDSTAPVGYLTSGQ